MKKRLLTSLLAVVCVAGANAQYAVDGYAYTNEAKFKVTQVIDVTNGNFADGLNGWTSETGTALSASTWEAVAVDDENDRTAVKSLAASNAAGTALSNMWELAQGEYVFSFWAKTNTGRMQAATALSSGNPPAGNLFFMSSSNGSDTLRILTPLWVVDDQWRQFTDTIQVNNEKELLIFKAMNIPVGVQFTGFEIAKVNSVYDTRIAERRLAYMEKLLQDDNFTGAEDEFDELDELVATAKSLIAQNKWDAASTATSFMKEVEEAFTAYMDASTHDITKNSYFPNIEDMTAVGKYNRGQISDGQIINCYKFVGSNWQHGQGGDNLNKYILPTNDNGDGGVLVVNSTLPKGKYFVSAEVQNGYANPNKDWGTYYYLESEVKGIVGKDTVSCGTISGEPYVRLYAVGEVAEDGKFEAGFLWMSPTQPTPCFRIKSFEVRSFVDVEDQVAHVKAWTDFKTQWNAAVGARNKTLELQADKLNYPWQQDSLARAITQWDPLYNAVIEAGWLDAEGNDAGVATTAELENWAVYQGTGAEGGDSIKYALVRGYQYANNYVIATNKVITDLGADIEDAKKVRDDDMNAQGDIPTFQKAIDAAEKELNDVKTTTTDATMQADSLKLASQRVTLAAAVEAFKKSAVLTPIADIDFANPFTEDADNGFFFINGATGRMEFGGASTVNTGADASESVVYAKGFGDASTDVLRIGNTNATVNLSEVPTDNDVIRFQFDMWFGKLVGKSIEVQLQNEAGDKVAGFSFSRYDAVTSYNDFSNDEGTGMDIINVASAGIQNVGNIDILSDAYRSSFDLIIDYKAQIMSGSVKCNGNTSDGAHVAIPEVTDNKIAKFVLSSNYNNAARRGWFDNLKVYKYASKAEGPEDLGVKAVSTVASQKSGVYTLTGLKVAADKSNLKPGLYIINGKKYVVK